MLYFFLNFRFLKNFLYNKTNIEMKKMCTFNMNIIVL